MPNLRICYDNIADTAQSITASSTTAALAAANLQNDMKGLVWRSAASTLQTLTLTWDTAQSLSMIALPWTNLTTSATVTVKSYTNTGDTTPAFTDSITSPVKVAGQAVRGMGVVTGVNAFAFGGASCAVGYFPQRNGMRKVVVEIADPGNGAGYIEASRLILGTYWEATTNPDVGASIQLVDTGVHTRTEAGDLKTDRGPRFKAVNLDLRMLKQADRQALWNILRGNGKVAPVFLSLLPAATDASEEDMWQVYGKLTELSALAYQFTNAYSHSLALEEV